MTLWRNCALIILIMLVPQTLLAEDRVTIVCDYKSTFDLEDGSRQATSGSESFTIVDESFVIGEQGPMTGTISDRAIDVTATRDLGIVKGEPAQLIYRLMVDRYSGNFKLLFTIEGKQGGLLHEGVCRPAQRLF